MKTIGILTSGGDSPGMNAAVRAVTRAAINRGIRVMGIRRGYSGLISGDIFEMDVRSVSDIIHRGGTVLYTARSEEFKTEEGMQKAIQTCKEFGIEGVVVIGGDGSFRGASDLSARGIPCVGLPGTIDNDVGCSDYTIGFDTAINTVIAMVDRLRDTAQSHDRCSVVEVMGRRAGYIALEAGIAVGASAILVPEVPYDIENDVLKRMEKISKTGKKHFIIIVAEGLEITDKLTEIIAERTQMNTRSTVLGHVQRGGSPTGYDRVMASRMGYHAVELLSQGIGNRVVAFKDSKIVDFDVQQALSMHKEFPVELYKMAYEISI
ncbi:6-phosphofructokinase [Feifania hominis]|uniref:ATP-dependent 6-phosphofructokinase n=1 Tax=Feifania hominis TaxID=2763660 RepID=A0A926HTB1_9FIRM|nr:6-phosphofructokinase [Feifania hominis]MBC8535128.1 6-phosphofructokinase [Feifania hominis]